MKLFMILLIKLKIKKSAVYGMGSSGNIVIFTLHLAILKCNFGYMRLLKIFLLTMYQQSKVLIF
jgi:hypothetical protein